MLRWMMDLLVCPLTLPSGRSNSHSAAELFPPVFHSAGSTLNDDQDDVFANYSPRECSCELVSVLRNKYKYGNGADRQTREQITSSERASPKAN